MPPKPPTACQPPTTRQTRQTVLLATSQPATSKPATSQPAVLELSTSQPSTFDPFVTTRKPRQKSSPLWAYTADLDADGNAPFSRIPGREKTPVFRCKPCIVEGNKKIKEYDAPRLGAHFRDHLYKKHGITV